MTLFIDLLIGLDLGSCAKGVGVKLDATDEQKKEIIGKTKRVEARQGNVLWIMRVLQTMLALLNQMGLAGGEKLASQ